MREQQKCLRSRYKFCVSDLQWRNELRSSAVLMVTVEAVNFNLCLVQTHGWSSFTLTARRAAAYFTILMFYQRTKVMTQVQILLICSSELPAKHISLHSHRLTISLTKIQTETAIIWISLENRNFCFDSLSLIHAHFSFLSFPAFSLLPLRSIWIDRFAVSLMSLFVDKS